MQAKQVMQTGVVVVSPELSLRQFEEFLTLEEVSGVPVVTNDGVLVGIASKTDVVTALAEQLEGDSGIGADLSVRDLMTPDVYTVGPDDSLEQVGRIMLDAGVHRVLVVEQGTIVGIITPFDLIQVALQRGAFR